MTLTNFEVIQIINGLNSLFDVDTGSLTNVELPVKLVYGVQKNYKRLMDEYRIYEKQLDDIKALYPDDKSSVHGNKLRELLDLDLDIDIYKVPDSVFESSDFKITLQQMSIFDFMMKQEE